MAFRQCPKRLWLEVHRPELREDSAQAQAKFKAGNQVGDIARHQYDPRNKGGAVPDAQAGKDSMPFSTGPSVASGR